MRAEVLNSVVAFEFSNLTVASLVMLEIRGVFLRGLVEEDFFFCHVGYL